MKKSIVLIATIITLTLFTSCSEEDGVMDQNATTNETLDSQKSIDSTTFNIKNASTMDDDIGGKDKDIDKSK